jgi:hypothetical protein
MVTGLLTIELKEVPKDLIEEYFHIIATELIEGRTKGKYPVDWDLYGLNRGKNKEDEQG